VWQIELHPDVEGWFLSLCVADPGSAERVSEAIDLWEQLGPSLGRPMVDRLRGSAFHNMKELRPGSSGTSEIRLIFVFDPRRQVILLVAGDKAGKWRAWYDQAIPMADARYVEHLAALEKGASA
jgi:hypothetical protein